MTYVRAPSQLSVSRRRMHTFVGACGLQRSCGFILSKHRSQARLVSQVGVAPSEHRNLNALHSESSVGSPRRGKTTRGCCSRVCKYMRLQMTFNVVCYWKRVAAGRRRFHMLQRFACSSQACLLQVPRPSWKDILRRFETVLNSPDYECQMHGASSTSSTYTSSVSSVDCLQLKKGHSYVCEENSAQMYSLAQELQVRPSLRSDADPVCTSVKSV